MYGKKEHTGSLIIAVAQAVHAAGMLLPELNKNKSRLSCRTMHYCKVTSTASTGGIAINQMNSVVV